MGILLQTQLRSCLIPLHCNYLTNFVDKTSYKFNMLYENRINCWKRSKYSCQLDSWTFKNCGQQLEGIALLVLFASEILLLNSYSSNFSSLFVSPTSGSPRAYFWLYCNIFVYCKSLYQKHFHCISQALDLQVMYLWYCRPEEPHLTDPPAAGIEVRWKQKATVFALFWKDNFASVFLFTHWAVVWRMWRRLQ